MNKTNMTPRIKELDSLPHAWSRGRLGLHCLMKDALHNNSDEELLIGCVRQDAQKGAHRHTDVSAKNLRIMSSLARLPTKTRTMQRNELRSRTFPSAGNGFSSVEA